ncbi:MAG: hypothetical protein Q9159_003091 [Coniocarpon cinnabarinum]
MVSTSGSQLLPEDAVSTLVEKLLPVTTILTPNIPEALLIIKNSPLEATGQPATLGDLVELARLIQGLGPRYVLIKGGHMPLKDDRLNPEDHVPRHFVSDVLHGDGETHIFKSEYLQSRNTHGTGCSLASVRLARDYVSAGIQHAVPLGSGSGPINHFHSTYKLPFAPSHFLDYLISHPRIAPVWDRHLHHPFTQQLANGTLPVQAFKHYMIQDYLFLIQYARANALAAYKAPTIADTADSASIVAHMMEEMNTHLSYCAEFGLDQAALESHDEDMATTAYTRYVLDIGNRQDWLALQIALAPCLIGYGAIAERIMNDPGSVRDGNRYWRWVDDYNGDSFKTAVRKGKELLERHAGNLSVSRVEELVEIFRMATRMEIGFWDMGLAAAEHSNE